MKQIKLLDYFWGVLLILNVFLWIYMAALFD